MMKQKKETITKKQQQKIQINGYITLNMKM